LVRFIFAYSCKPTVEPSSAGGCQQTECRLPTWRMSPPLAEHWPAVGGRF